MNILAIDTSNLPLSIAVVNDDKVLGEWTLNVERNHSIRLLPAIRTLLEEVRLTPKEIDLFVVARGPGSYTGVRIGVTTAKSLAWAVSKPLVGISSLEALAHQIPLFNGVIIPLFDARRDRFYTAGYEWQSGKLIEVLSEQIFHKEELARLLYERGGDVLFVGDDARKHREYLEEALAEQAYFLPPAYQIPRAAHLAHLGYKLYEKGQIEEITFTPTYLQPTEAEVNLRK